MKKIFIPLLILLLGISFQTKAQIDSTNQGELSDLILQENQDFFIQYRTTKKLTDGFIARFFLYKIKNDDWPGGIGFEITHPQRKEPLWYKMIHGDFGPHSVQLLDIDQNGSLDLFFYAGFEDVFSTYIYTANYQDILSDSFDENNFLKTYSNENDYSVLLKPEGANQPLILDSGFEGTEHRSNYSCFEDRSQALMPENRLTISDPIKKEIKRKYREVTGSLDKYNFDYNMPDVYALFNTKILDPIKLFKIHNHKTVEVTSEYPKYLTWRMMILRQIQKSSSDKCRANIERAINHLKQYF